MTTLAALKTAADNWLIRDDLSTGSDFSTILLLAESEIAKDVRCVIQEQAATLTFSGRSANLPYNFMELRDVFLDNNMGQDIEYRTPQALRKESVYVNGRVASFYTLEGGSDAAGDERVQMTIAGPASATTTQDVEILYWARFAALSSDTDTNWLLANHFDVYLNAVLWQAAVYLHAHDLVPGYKGMYDESVAKLARHENRKRYGATPKQSAASPRTVV